MKYPGLSLRKTTTVRFGSLSIRPMSDAQLIDAVRIQQVDWAVIEDHPPVGR